jgi:4-hydroxy-4-methyl-2-oxoglutarate aldolase
MQAIVKDFKRPSRTLLDRFAKFQAAAIHEGLGKRGALTNDFKPIYPGAKFCGSAFTIKGYPGDNLMLHVAISLAQPGDVLVCSVSGYREAGHWGEIVSVAAMQKGVAALVIDGSVRDAEPIQKLNFPIFATALSMKGTTKKQAGTINHPLAIGGIIVNPGDIVLGDVDGVVVVPQAEAEAVLAKTAEIEKRESEWIEKIRKGTCTLDLLNVRGIMKELGLE